MATKKEQQKSTVKVQLVRSPIGTKEAHRATVRGLGLRKLNSVSELEDLGLAEVDLLALKTAKLVGQIVQNVKVIKSGELKKAVKLTGIGATAGAKAAIEAAGGSLN
jgi:ribosomal protein L15